MDQRKFNDGMKLGTASPAPTSVKSENSMDRPIQFNDGSIQDRLTSSAPSFVSMKSDHSMDKDIKFNSGMKLGTASPAPTFVKSENSMDRPIKFSDGELSASLLKEDHFRCSVCADVLKEPVFIPCGHSYCKTCIQTYWTKPIHSEAYSCPQCRETFNTLPVLKPNSALSKVVEKLKQVGFSPALPAQCYAESGDVACDFCTGRKLRAVKSCLTCTASYCETHVKQHYTVTALQRHTLVEPTGDLQHKLCKLHHRILEVFCKTDQTFICLMCVMKEHKDHDTVVTKSEDPTSKEQIKTFIDDHKVIKHTFKETEKMSVKVQNSETELFYLVKSCYRGLEEANDFTSSCVEVTALGRQLDLGMLYDCCDDSFRSDVCLWDKDTLYSARLSFRRPHTDVRILEGDSLQERLRALDLTPPLRASVVAGMVEVDGAAAFLKHPTQSQLKDRVTVHYRTSTRLDMLSHTLLHNGPPLSLTNQNTATHVVVAVLYGVQTFFVFDNESNSCEDCTELRGTVEKIITCTNETEFLSRISKSEQTSHLLYDCAVYTDAENLKRSVDCKELSTYYQKLLEPNKKSCVPLKVWLYPLKNLKCMSTYVVREINEDLLRGAENILEVLDLLETDLQICQDMTSSYSNLSVISWFLALKESLSEFSSCLKQYRAVFQRTLASCIKTIRQRGEEGEKCLRDLLRWNSQSPFSPQNMYQWLQNKDAEVKALNECRNKNITTVKSTEELKHFIQDSHTDRVLCFTLTSLEGEDHFLSALKQHIDLMNTMNIQETQQPFKLSDTSHKILSDLCSFLFTQETEYDNKKTRFIAAAVPDGQFPGSSIHLYHSGSLLSRNLKIDVKPAPVEVTAMKSTSVNLRLQSSGIRFADRYRVEYRVRCKGVSPDDIKWKAIEIWRTGGDCVVLGVTPWTQYQLRYAVMDSNSMSDYSIITEFQTARDRPGLPSVIKQNKESLVVTWEKVDGDSPVLHYMVEYMEAGLEGWQFILTGGTECECTINLPYSTCYRVRVSAVYGEGDTSRPSDEVEVPVEVWNINLSERKASLYLEILKLQTVKKPVELRGWSDEESEVRSFLQCLPFISQLSGAEHCVPSLCKELWSIEQPELVSPLLQALGFTLSLGGELPTSSCRAVGRVLGLSASTLNLTLNPQAISLKGVRLLFTHTTHLNTLRLSTGVVVRMVRALSSVGSPAPVSVDELSLILSSTQQPGGALSRVLSSLASLLRLWNVRCLNLTEYKMEAQSLTVLLCLQDPLTIRLCKETLQQLVVVVYDTQEEELTHCFLQKVGGDLTSCTLNWEVIQYFLQHGSVTVDFRKSNIKQQKPRDLLPLLDRLQIRKLSSSFVLSIIREIHQTGSAHCVSNLLSSVENCINLNNRELDSVHCAALCFTLQHCTAVSLSLLFTSIPQGELESIVPFLKHVSHLSVDRLMLLKLLHCCSVSKLQQGAAVLLSSLQHRLDFSSSSALDLTEDTHTLTLSTADCRVVSMVIQRIQTHTHLTLHDCEIEEAGVEQLFPILHTIILHCSKALLLQFLVLVRVGTELECVRRAGALARALGLEVDLSHTRLDQQACSSLVLVLEHSEGLSELDLSHCQLTDHCLQLLFPHLHKTNVLDLSHNDITDVSAKRIYDTVSTNNNIHTVRLFNNRITDRQLFLSDKRFEIW